MKKYDHREIEKKWQKRWEESDLYKALDDSAKEKFYCLDMFPYPSGEGLHVGHVEGYTASDVYARHKRMKGFSVLHPMGWDAFGLPAENYAIKTKVHPKKTTAGSIETFRRQIKSLGFSYDWSREIGTHLPEYYKWTQWLFLLLYKNGLAYKKLAKVNWCESCKTVLANEQVINGRCERCNNEVVQKDLAQWFFKITQYAEELISGLDTVDWPASTAINQKNWIGRSEGAEIDFQVTGDGLRGTEKITVFTTRPDTLFGATYMVLAPEHPLVQALLPRLSNKGDVLQYIGATAKKTELERQADGKDKTGVELKGVRAINPANGEEIPIFIADYVLASYGTGAIMAVPAHDERDLTFAKKFGIAVRPVILKTENTSRSFIMGIEPEEVDKFGGTVAGVTEKGFSKIHIPIERIEEFKAFIRERMEPGFWNEFSTSRGFYFIFKHKDGSLEEMELTEKTNDLIDRYGETFNDRTPREAPANVYGWLAENSFYRDILIHTEPGTLINSGSFSGLDSEEAKKRITEFVKGRPRVTYKLRDWLVSRQRYWGAPIPIIYCDDCGMHPVPEKDLPVLLPEDVDFMPTGESPLVKSKSFHKVRCPACKGPARRESDTMDTFVCSSWYFFRFVDPRNAKEFASKKLIKKWLPVDLYIGGAEHTVLHLMYSRFFAKALADLGHISFREPFAKLRHQGLILAEDGRKMSKSLGNVINPDEVVERLGADALRLHEMFLGPLENAKPWSSGAIAGVRRFLEKVWRQAPKATACATAKPLLRLIHQTIKKVGDDIENLHLNTAISQLMICANALDRAKEFARKDFELFVKTLAPFAPHIAEEIWERLQHTTSIHEEDWPAHAEEYVQEREGVIAIQIDGKTRATIFAPLNSSEEEVREKALVAPAIQKYLSGKEPKKFIYVRGRLLSIVTKS